MQGTWAECVEGQAVGGLGKVTGGDMKRNSRKKVWSRLAAGVLTIAMVLAPLPDSIGSWNGWGQKTAQAASDTGKNVSFTSGNGEFTIQLREVRANDYWYEYYLSVTNHASQAISDWSVVLNCSNAGAYSKAFECSAKNNGDGSITVKGSGNNKVIAAGQTVSSSSSFKIAFGSAVDFTGAQITYNYGNVSTGGDADGGVGYGNTYIDNYSCKYTLTGQAKDVAMADTPVGKHGGLHVSGTQLMDAHDQPMILRGASTHGMHWGEMGPFVNKAAFQNLRDEWGVNLVRLVSYVTQGGYTEGSQSTLDDLIQKGVSYADELGMYALIDWHIHNESPVPTKAQAIRFFDKYSKKYADHDNVLYEICNEPLNTPWSTIRSYAVDVVKTIRANDPDAIIIVGTNTWSQDVDEVATNGGKIDDPNVMYTVHFYSGTHKQSLRDKVQTALNAGTPVFCTEFGVCDASGNGGFDLDEADTWINFFEEKGISYCCWSFCNKDESASMLSPQCNKKSGFVNSDLGATGAWLINTYRSKAGDQPDAAGTSTPVVSNTPSVVSTAKPDASAPVYTNTPTSAAPAPSADAGYVLDQVLYDSTTDSGEYTPQNLDWFYQADDADKVTAVYTCTESGHDSWGIMGWGATVNGKWTDGLTYQAGSPSTTTMTKTYTVKEIKDSLGYAASGTISSLKITTYNGGVLQQLLLYKKGTAVTTETPTGSNAPNVSGTPRPTGSSAPNVSNAPDPTGSSVPNVSNAPDPAGSSTPDVSGQPVSTSVPQTSAKPTQTPSGSFGQTGYQPIVSPSSTAGTSVSGDNGSVTSTAKAKVVLKKKTLTVKRGKKVTIRISKKAAGDRVVKYRIKGKKIITVNKKGVVKGQKKGRTKVIVLMKSGAKAVCSIRVR